ncbi:MAG: hypothetical protein KKC51_09395 [Verrucomicrobia bacterium]|nr:hypothetical protein [Verrucomicrobiota bacterium]
MVTAITLKRCLVGAALLAGAGCAPEKTARPPAANLIEVMVVLDPVVTNRPWGQGFLPKAERFSAAADPAEVLPRIGPDRVLIIPDARGLPVHWWSPIKAYLEKGGAVLFCGLDPFEDRVRLENGQPVTEAAFLSTLLAQARSAGLFSSVRTWLHENDSGELRGAVRLAESGEAPWPAIEVDVEAFHEWDAMTFGSVRRGTVAPGENSLAFYAHGDGQTSRLFIECRERDGSMWGRSVEVGPDWAPHIVPQASFRHLGGSAQRGGTGDGFRLEQLRWIRIGLAMAGAPQSPGAHLFGLSEVRLVADPRLPEEAIGWPDIPLVSPPCRRYRTTASALRDLERGATVKMAVAPVGSPFALPRGTLDSGTPVGRWIPLSGAEDERGELLGWPVSLFLAGSSGGAWWRWGWVALDPVGSMRPVAERVVAAAVRRLSGGLFFRYAGCPRWIYKSHEEIRVLACWEGRHESSGIRVAAELKRESDGRIMRRAVLSAVTPGRPFEISLGLVSESETVAEDYRVVLTLEDLRIPGLLYDRVEQGIKILSDKPPFVPRLTAAGGRFLLRGTPFFIAGVHYAPLVEVAGADRRGHWLDPLFFDADNVRRDMRRMKMAGHNGIFIEYGEEGQAAPLRYVVEEARRQEFLVVVSVAGLDPLAPDWERAARLLRAADIAGMPHIMALSLDTAEVLSRAGGLRRLDPAWRAWLVEQYGSVEQAEQSAGLALWRENGEVSGPPDEGGEEPAVALYRRFLDDYFSRRVGWLRRHLDALGCRQMLTARFHVGRRPADLLSPGPAAAHLDFVSLSVGGPSRVEPNWDEAARAAATARRAGGQPVVWHGGQLDIGPEPRSPDLANQARWFDRFFDLVLQTQAAGCFAWSYPGGWCASRGEDVGLAGEDGSWRPAGQALQNAIPRFRRAQAAPVQVVRDMIPSEDFLKAEWGRIQVDGVDRERLPGEPVRVRPGQMLRVDLINTGPATWEAVPGETRARVLVQLAGQGASDVFPVRPLRFGERDGVSWRAGDPGDWALRAWDAQRGLFGERLIVKVEEKAVALPE